jgi:diguanylate cyclase (GGDEF)-like protein
VSAGKHEGWSMVSAPRLAEIVERLSAERRPDRLASITLDAALLVTGGHAGRLVGPAGAQGQAQLAVEGVAPPHERPASADLPGRDGSLGRIEVWGAVDDPSALAALRLVAFHCARTLENEHLRRIQADDRRRARRLTAAVTALREAVDPTAAVAVGLAEARALAAAPAAALVVTTSGRLEVAACDGIDPLHEPGASALVPEHLRAEIAAGRPWVGHLAIDSPMREWGFGSAAILPVGEGGGFGFLVVLGGDREQPSEDATGILVQFAGHLGAALITAVLQQEMRGHAAVDPLTRLFNARYFHNRIDQECQRALRAGTVLSLLRMELDDVAEMRAGGRISTADAATEALARHLAAGVRGMDVVCRVGDDELAAILPEVAGIDALRVGERLRATLGADPALAGGFTLSLGVASFPDQATSPELLVANALSALDWARREGGDRTFLFHADAAAILRAEERDSGTSADAESLVATLAALAAAVDWRHPRTTRHSENTARIAALLGGELGLPPDRVEDLHIAGLLHDVGKIGLGEDLVGRPGPLTAADAEDLRRHPEIGERMLSGSRLARIRPWVLHHHERMDGTGYPAGLAGPAIPLEARILAVASAFERLASGDPLREPVPAAEAVRLLEARAGAELDRVVVTALRALVGRGAAGVAPVI